MPDSQAAHRLHWPGFTARSWPIALAVMALAVYAAFLWPRAAVAPGGADSSGYFNMAKLILQGKVHDTPRIIEGLPMREMPSFAYAPLGFVPDPNAAHITPTYPIGLPLLFGASSLIAGWRLGPAWVILLHSLATIVLAYLLARQCGARREIAWLAAAALALSPLHLMFSLQAMSDMPAATWCAAALWFARQDSRRAALACGAAFGMAVLIRPTNVLLALPLAIGLGKPGARWAWGIAGGLPFAIGLALFNLSAYGNALLTGYGSVVEFFALHWIPTTAWHYLRWLPVTLSPLVLLAVLLPWFRNRPDRTLWMHASWVIALAALYSAYAFTHRDWWYLRFILPVFPSLLAIGAAAGEKLAHLIDRSMPRWCAGAAAAAIIAANGYASWHNLHLKNTGPSVRTFAAMETLVRAHVPPSGVVLAMEASGALYFSTQYTLVRWDSIDDAWPRAVAACRQAGRPVYAALFDFEDRKKFDSRTPGAWEAIAVDGNATLWRLDSHPAP